MHQEKKRRWAEICSDYMDEDGILYIDAWKTGNADEQGSTIAYVDTYSGRVMYVDPDARIDAYAQEIIQKVSNEAKRLHPYSVEELESVLSCVVAYEMEEPDLGATVENLSSMGFSEEMMRFFKVPEAAE